MFCRDKHRRISIRGSGVPYWLITAAINPVVVIKNFVQNNLSVIAAAARSSQQA